MILFWLLIASVLATLGVIATAAWKKRAQTHAIAKILGSIKETGERQGKVLCVVNPISGGGIARQLAESLVLPVFKKRGWEVVTFFTQAELHALAYCSLIPANLNYELVVSVGGDGLFYEVINGFWIRQDKNKGIEQCRLPEFCIAPLGTSNGIFTSLFPAARRKKIWETTMTAIDGPSSGKYRIQPQDLLEAQITRQITPSPLGDRKENLTTIIQKNGNRVMFSLSISIGLIADGDVLAESKLRFFPGWASPLRVLVAQMIAVFGRKTKRAKIRWTPVKIEEKDGKRTITPQPLREETDDFGGVTLINIPWLSWDAQCVPKAKVDDGLMHLMIIRKSGTIPLIRSLAAAEQGRHTDWSFIEIHPCISFELDPLESKAVVVADGMILGSCAFKVGLKPSVTKFRI